ncbi:MAG: ATP-binding cassette domain-containing protein [Gammaproteobacteria bacterium]|nr:ATP-binding cassette domain-containing protein [Gammaproteobacteria bacterium]
MIIQLKNISKIINNRIIVNNLSFTMRAGHCFGLLGPNGAGKTTTINMILGLITPSSGQLTVFDMQQPRHGSKIRKKIGVVSQEDNLDPDFSVFENLIMHGRYFRLAKDQIVDQANSLLASMELLKHKDLKPLQLSGGMRRRLSIARALMNTPELIVLDEPTTGLDPQVRHLIWERLRELRNQGTSILLTTHYMEEAERLCDELMILDQGIAIESGTPRELINQHIEPHVFELDKSAAQTHSLKNTASQRIEMIGDTVYIYTTQSHLVRQHLDALSDDQQIHYLHRPANLEDVFLKITGRDLDE